MAAAISTTILSGGDKDRSSPDINPPPTILPTKKEDFPNWKDEPSKKDDKPSKKDK